MRSLGAEFFEWGYYAAGSEDGSTVIIGQHGEPGIQTSMGSVFIVKRKKTGDYEWIKTFGGDYFDWGYSLSPAEAGFLISGLTFSFGSGKSDMYMILTDNSGNCINARTFGGGNYDDAYAGIQAHGSGYILAGSTASFGAGKSDFYIVKTDEAGNMEWQKYYGYEFDEAAFSIARTADKGYIAAGMTESRE